MSAAVPTLSSPWLFPVLLPHLSHNSILQLACCCRALRDSVAAHYAPFFVRCAPIMRTTFFSFLNTTRTSWIESLMIRFHGQLTALYLYGTAHRGSVLLRARMDDHATERWQAIRREVYGDELVVDPGEILMKTWAVHNTTASEFMTNYEIDQRDKTELTLTDLTLYSNGASLWLQMHHHYTFTVQLTADTHDGIEAYVTEIDGVRLRDDVRIMAYKYLVCGE